MSKRVPHPSFGKNVRVTHFQPSMRSPLTRARYFAAYNGDGSGSRSRFGRYLRGPITFDGSW